MKSCGCKCPRHDDMRSLFTQLTDLLDETDVQYTATITRNYNIKVRIDRTDGWLEITPTDHDWILIEKYAPDTCRTGGVRTDTLDIAVDIITGTGS